MDTLNVGTVEVVSVYLTDRLNNISSIPSADFKIVTEDESSVVVNWATVFNILGMRVDVLVDTTTGGGWAEGVYKLYVRANIAPEGPIVGPFEFGVS